MLVIQTLHFCSSVNTTRTGRSFKLGHFYFWLFFLMEAGLCKHQYHAYDYSKMRHFSCSMLFLNQLLEDGKGSRFIQLLHHQYVATSGVRCESTA